ERTGKEDLRGFEWYYLWNLCHSNLVTIQGHTGPVSSLAFSPNGKYLASASQDQSVRVWDAWTGRELLTLKPGNYGGVNGVAFSPDGKWLAAACGVIPFDRGQASEVKVWDVPSGREVHTFKRQTSGGGNPVVFTSVAFSPDGKWLA